MLDFFRRYQRYFFIFIAIVIVITFAFFGTYQTMGGPEKQEDWAVGKTVDGSMMMNSEVKQMMQFLWSDRNDQSLNQKGIIPNCFNDGVIRKDLLGTGIGVLLAHAYFDQLKEELSEKMQRHKEFRPYKHPSAPFISVENLWAQVLPSQKANLEYFLSKTEEMTPETFSLLVDLYLGETAFPPTILRDFLLYQEKHHNWIEPDPALPGMNLNFFRCATVEDWFGRSFLKLSAQFIINAAAIAHQKGYRVTEEEAKVDLLQNGYETLQTQLRRASFTQEEFNNFWKKQLHYLGMGEKEAVNVWQKIMLFRRLFDDIGGAVFVDPHLYQTFYSFASKTADIELYELPDALALKDFSSLMKLELYLDQVAKNRKDLLALPQNFATAAEVEKRCPELVEQRFLVEVAEVANDEVAQTVNLNEMWEWQLEPENFALLEKQFPQLALKNAKDPEGYFTALEKLPVDVRQKVDRFSRGKIVEAHPEWIEEALNQKHLNLREVSLSSAGELTSIEGIQEGKKLGALFVQAALKGEIEEDPRALEARSLLELYTENHETYYRFQILDRNLAKAVITFAEANERGILDALLEKHLESSYPQIRSKNPSLFKGEESEWKPLSSVRNEVGRLIYATLLKEIDTKVAQLGLSVSSDRDLDDFYPKYRFYPYMVSAAKSIRLEGEESAFLQKNEDAKEDASLLEASSLNNQWTLKAKKVVFKNHEKSPYFSADVFAMLEKSWSDVAPRADGRLSFFQLQEKTIPAGNFSREMKQGQGILSQEAKRYFMTDVLHKLKDKQAIHLSDDSFERP